MIYSNGKIIRKIYTMFLWALLKRFSKKDEKKQIVRDVIFKLKLDSSQEQLYLESLDILDNENLDLFYRKLVALVDILEERGVMDLWQQQTKKIQNIRKKEEKDVENMWNFNILFDNI